MPQRLKGKSAVVTGGGSAGIGGAVSRALAGEGASVVVNDIGRDAEGNKAADKMVEGIKKAGGSAIANYDSITTMQGGANIIQAAVSNFGKIDILVNCAGNFWLKPTTEMTEQEWDSILSVHIKGTFSLVKAALPEMMKQKSGRIINFSSRAAFNGPAAANASYSNLAYNTAKAGILGLTAALAQEVKPHGITVNSVLPSAVTPLFPGKKGMLEDNLPVPQPPDPEYVVPTVIFLVSDEAKNVTGQFLYAGGGDICIFGRPLRLPGPHTLLHKNGKWTVEEIADTVLPLMGIA